MEIYIVIIIAAIMLIGMVVYLVFLYEKKRSDKLMDAANGIGFQFSRKAEIVDIPAFQLFSKGHSKKYNNIMIGKKDGINWTIFDYMYTVGYGKSQKTYNQTIGVAKIENLSIPQFSLGPENFFHKIGEKFGMQDIDFPEKPEFSKKFLLKGENENAIRELFTNEPIRMFEQFPRPFMMEGLGNSILIYRSLRRIKPEELIQFIDESSGLIKAFRKNDF